MRVVLRPLLGIPENGVGFGDLLEAVLGVGLLAAIGVVPRCELAERALDRVRVSRDAETFVVVPPLVHRIRSMREKTMPQRRPGRITGLGGDARHPTGDARHDLVVDGAEHGG